MISNNSCGLVDLVRGTGCVPSTRKTTSRDPYRVGQQIRLAGGAFDGLVATIIEMHERDRLTVLMDLLNRPVKVKVEETQVAPV